MANKAATEAYKAFKRDQAKLRKKKAATSNYDDVRKRAQARQAKDRQTAKNLTTGAVQQSVGMMRKGPSAFFSAARPKENNTINGTAAHRTGYFNTRRNDRRNDRGKTATQKYREQREQARQRAVETSNELKRARYEASARESKAASAQIERGTTKIENEKKTMTKGGKWLTDAYVGGIQLAGDLTVGAVTGTGVAPMVLRASGGGVHEAEKEGATKEQALIYGAATGAVEGATERLFSVGKILNAGFGKGVGDDIVDRVIKKAASKASKQGIKDIWHAGGKWMTAAITEGLEEVIAEGVEPELANAIYDANKATLRNNPQEAIKNMAYAGSLGAALGGIAGGGGVLMEQSTGRRVINNTDPEELKEAARTASSVDNRQDAARAQALYDQLDSGQGITSIQANELQTILRRQESANRQKRESANRAAQAEWARNGYATTLERSTADKRANDVADRTREVVETSDWGEESEAVKNRSQELVGRMARIETGKALDDDIDTFINDAAARTVFETVTGQQIPSGNNVDARDFLYAHNAGSTLSIAEEQTQRDRDRAYTRLVTENENAHGPKGQQAFERFFQEAEERGFDVRDGDLVSDMVKAFDIFYEGARSDYSFKQIQKLFKGDPRIASLDMETRHAAYEAGVNDARSAVAARAQKQEERISTWGRSENQGRLDTSGVSDESKLSPQVRAVLRDLARAFGIEIRVVDDILTEDGEASEHEGMYEDGVLTLALNVDRSLLSTFTHEITHHLEDLAPTAWASLRNFVVDHWGEIAPRIGRDPDINAEIERKQKLYKKAKRNLSREGAIKEIIAETPRLFTDGETISAIVRADRSTGVKILEAIREVLRKIRAIIAEHGFENTRWLQEDRDALKQAERLWMDALAVAQTRRDSVDMGTGKRLSFAGYADSGRGIYVNDYAPGTQKSTKVTEILGLVQNVWSKKPISLTVGAEGRIVEAVFDPYFDENEDTDAGKIAGGNTSGSSSEKRVNLNIGKDYYRILSEAEYLDTHVEDELHDETRTHVNGQLWHYFVNDIYYMENETSGEMEPYSVIINVRENDDGTFVYGFETYKSENVPKALKRKRITAKPTLVGRENSLNADNSSKNIIEEHNPEVNTERRSIADGFESGDANVPRFSIREADPPKKTKGKIYKLLKLYPDGSLGALFIDKGIRLQVGEWYDADSPAIKDLENLETGHTYFVDADGNASVREYRSKSGNPGKKDVEQATRDGGRLILVDTYKDGSRKYHNWGINGSGSVSTFAMRPGWHATDAPAARHIGAGKNGGESVWRREDEVWCEISLAADVDYQQEAEASTSKDIQTHIPTDGYYYFKTNTNADDDQAWYISGAIRIDRILSDDEAEAIAKENGVTPDLPRKSGRKFDPEGMDGWFDDGSRLSVADDYATITPDRLDSLIEEYAIPGNETSDYSKAWIATINPRDFLTLTVADDVLETWQLGTENGWGQKVRELEPKDLKRARYMPYLTIDSRDSHSVVGHEGRHRMLAMARAGITESPVVIRDISESTKQNKQAMDTMDLWSQDFGDGPVNDTNDGMGADINVYDVIPINEKNRSEIDRIYGGDTSVQFSIAEDSEGRKLTENQREYFRDSKVRDAEGRLIPVYHSTDADFTIFDRERLGDSTGYPNTAFGHFVTPNREFSQRFGGNTMEMYANITNPIIHPYGCHAKYPDRADEIVRTWFEAVDPDQLPFLESSMEEDGFDSLYDAYMNAYSFEAFDYSADEREAVEASGYDGIELVEGMGEELELATSGGVSSYIVFDSNQLKNVDNADPTEDPDVRYSVRDEEYMKAVESGDDAKATRMVREAAQDAGLHTVHFFHGTLNKCFTIFDKLKAHLGGNSGAGFYFSTEEGDSENNYSDVEGADNYFKASHLAERILEDGEWQGEEIDDYDRALEIAKEELDKTPGVFDVFLKYDTPYIRDYDRSTNIFDIISSEFDESTVDRDDYEDEDDYEEALWEARDEHIYETVREAVYNAYSDLESLYEIVYGPSVEDVTQAIFEECVSYEKITWDTIQEALYGLGETIVTSDGWGEDAEATPEIVRAIIENFGYDAIEDHEVSTKFNQLIGMEDATHVIVFRPNQIKLADPVTRDDEGNVIPLSKRFDLSNNDVRYSINDDNEALRVIREDLGPTERAKIDEPRTRYSIRGDRTPTVKPVVKAEGATGDIYRTYDGEPVESTVIDMTEEIMKIMDKEDQIEGMRQFRENLASYMEFLGAEYTFIGLEDVNNASIEIRRDNEGNPVSIVLTAMVKNGEYPVNFDFSSICKKREAVTKLINELSKRENGEFINRVSLSQANLWRLNEILRDEGFETACLGCFVETKRYNIEAWSDSLSDKWNKAVEKINPGADYFNFATDYPDSIAYISDVLENFKAEKAKRKEALKKERQEAREKWIEDYKAGHDVSDKKAAKAYEEHWKEEHNAKEYSKDWHDDPSLPNEMSIEAILEADPRLRKKLRRVDLITPEGIKGLLGINPDMYGVLYGHYGSGTPKPVQPFTPYNSEIAMIGRGSNRTKKLNPKSFRDGNDKQIQKLREIGGLRTQSFSDFLIQNVYDYVQMIADMAARDFPGHAYSKEIAFARIFGMTGLKINMSIMFDVDPDSPDPGLDKDGNYIIADKARQDREKKKGRLVFAFSFPWDEAVELQKDPRYDGNVGTIGVGLSDKHIRKMLGDSDFKFIIPYHKSSLPREIAKASHLELAQDYTGTQNTVRITSVFEEIDKTGWKRRDWIAHYYEENPDAEEGDAEKIWKSGKKIHTSKYGPEYFHALYEKHGTWRKVFEIFNKEIEEKGYTVKTAKAGGQNDGATVKFDIYTGEYGLDATHDPKATVEHYFDYCLDHGWLPLFYQFADHENYYKLLYDFTVYKSDGTYAPQEAVTNTYPDDVLDIIKEYVVEANKEKKKQAPAWNRVVEKSAKMLEERTAGIEETNEDSGARMSVRDDTAEPVSDDDVFSWMADNPDELIGKDGDIADLPVHDQRINMSRERRERTLEEIQQAAQWVKNETKLTHGRRLDPRSIKESVNGVVRRLMENAETKNRTSHQYVKLATASCQAMRGYLLDDDFDSAADIAYDTALEIIENVRIINDTYYEEYKAMRDFFGQVRIRVPEEFRTGEYNELRKQNFGRLIISNDGQDIDALWSEICETFPGHFDPEALLDPMEMLQEISAEMDAVKPFEEEYTSEEMDRIASVVAMDLMEISWAGKPIQTFADRKKAQYDQRVKALKARHQEALKEARQKAKERADARVKAEREKKKKAVKEAKEKGKEDLRKERQAQTERRKEAVRKEREKGEQRLQEEKEKGRERVQEARERGEQKLADQKARTRERDLERKESADKREALRKMKNNVKWLSDRLLNPTDDKHLPEGYRRAVAQILAVLDLQTERSKELEEKYGVSKARFKWLELKRQYEEIARGESYGFILDEELLDLMDTLAEELEDHPLSDATAEELNIIHKVVQAIRHGIAHQNKAFSEALKAETDALGRSTIRDAEENLRVHGQRKDIWFLTEGMATPRDYFEGIGGGMQEAFMALRAGMDTHIRDIDEIRHIFTDIFGSYGNKKKPGSELEKWRDNSQTRKFDLEGGGSIELNPAQIMSLYCLMKREQAVGHILGSGVVASEVRASEKIKDFITNADGTSRRRKIRQYFSGKNAGTRGQKVIPSLTDIVAIINTLTEDQKQMADRMMSVLNTTMSEWGNETSMKMFGYRKFEEEHYFPIRVTSDYLATDFDVRQTAERVKNPGFAKGTVKGAHNPIVIADIFEVVADHCNAMSMYRAFAPAIADFQRVYNFVDRDKKGRQIASVKESLKACYGQNALKYIERFMTDLNGTTPKVTESLTHFATKSLANYKKAAIAGNLRVALQQPTAIIRAFSMIDPKYFIGGFSPIRSMREMREHCPIGLWKSWGHNDVDMARSMEDIMMNKEWSRIDAVTMEIYGRLDEMTWGQIWAAVKREVRAKHRDVEEGSQEFWDLCNERASEVFDKTQVVDSVFHRSQMMRNSDVFSKMTTSFMAEPTRTFNMMWGQLRDAHQLWEDGDKSKAVTKANRALTVFVVNAAVCAASAAIADTLRGKSGDDDDDEKEKKDALGRYIANLIANFKDMVNPLLMIPIVKDIWGFKDGFGTSNMSLEGYDKLVRAWMDIWSGSDKKTGAEKARAFAEGIGYVTGLPIKNVMREIETIFGIVGIDVFAEEKDAEVDTQRSRKLLEYFGVKDGSTADNILNRAGIGLTEAEQHEKDLQEQIDNIRSTTDGLEGYEREDKVWSMATKGYTKMVEAGDYAALRDVRRVLEACGGDVDKFDEKVLGKTRSMMKRSIGDEMDPARIEEMREYMLRRGMTKEEISHDVVAKSDAAKEYQEALASGDDARMMDILTDLVAAGLTYEDMVALDNKVYSKGTGTFQTPVEGGTPILRTYRGQPMLNIACPEGTDILAPDNGRVTSVGWKKGYGYTVTISHGNGCYTYYNHLQSYGVRKGDVIRKGTLIAKCGSTGDALESGVGIKMKRDGVWVDPSEELY